MQADASGTQPVIRRLTSKDWEAGDKFSTYDHGAFRVSYPAKWQVIGDRNTSITIYPNGDASKETVAYGTILSGFTPNRGGNDLNDATLQLIASMQDTNQGLRRAGNPVNISVNQQPAKSIEMVGQSVVRENNRPLEERVRLVTLKGRGGRALHGFRFA